MLLFAAAASYTRIAEDSGEGDWISIVLAAGTWIVGVMTAVWSITASLIVLFRCTAATAADPALQILAFALAGGSIGLGGTWIMQTTDAIRGLPMSRSVPAPLWVYLACATMSFLQVTSPDSCRVSIATVYIFGLGLQMANVAAESYGRRRYWRMQFEQQLQ